MALPMTEYPLVDIHVHALDKEVSFRPFLVKEEKLLVLAAESGEESDMIKATQQIITNCSFGKVDGEKLPIFDMQRVFIELRKISVSDKISAKFACGNCEKHVEMEISLDTFKLNTNDEHTKVCKVNDKLTVEMRYPTAKELSEIAGVQQLSELYNVAAACMDVIHFGEDTISGEDINMEEKIEFIDNMTSDQFDIIKKFFETMPVVENEINFDCPHCGTTNQIYMNGYLDFFA
tara:strand:- start:6800 stop:7501 length:702 start_codon:yes stop_codon:yes gene_type:complete